MCHRFQPFLLLCVYLFLFVCVCVGSVLSLSWVEARKRGAVDPRGVSEQLWGWRLWTVETTPTRTSFAKGRAVVGGDAPSVMCRIWRAVPVSLFVHPSVKKKTHCVCVCVCVWGCRRSFSSTQSCWSRKRIWAPLSSSHHPGRYALPYAILIGLTTPPLPAVLAIRSKKKKHKK